MKNVPVRNSTILSFASWTSFFVLAWRLLLGWSESNGLSWGFLAFFFLVAICAGAVASVPMAGKNAN